MFTDRSPYALLVVQVAVARFVGVNPGAICGRHRFEADLRLDSLDVALVALTIAAQLEIEVSLTEIEEATTVDALAACFARILSEKDALGSRAEFRASAPPPI